MVVKWCVLPATTCFCDLMWNHHSRLTLTKLHVNVSLCVLNPMQNCCIVTKEGNNITPKRNPNRAVAKFDLSILVLIKNDLVQPRVKK